MLPVTSMKAGGKTRRRHMAPRRTVLPAPELAVYLLVVAYVVQLLVREGVGFCQRLQQHGVHVPGLQTGWFGLKNDLSDPQWREFRGSMPLLTAVMAAFVAASRTVQALAPAHRTTFYVAAACVVLGVMHGACVVYVLALALAGYFLADLAAGRPYGLLAVWAWHCSTFLVVRVYEGFPFAMFGPRLAFLDGHRGMLRWHIHYNLLLLRMISYAADLHFMRTRRPARVKLPQDTPPAPDLQLRDRVELCVPARWYALGPYLAYCLYLPLYIAGPIATFNSFASQLQAPSSRLTPRAVLTYLARAAACWLTLEAVTHTLWFMSIARHRVWADLAAAQGRALSALDMCLVPWWVMLGFWLKFLVIWRFFRLFALADGVDVPENMTRCICNNYDVVGFWRNWHASYNQWLVRYLYIPLGGGAWRALNVWPIFTFVALWHDLEVRLLGWAWLMALLVTPELLAKWAGRQPWCVRDKRGRAFRYLQGGAAAVNIVLLMAANMVGFVFGLEGIRPFLVQVLGSPRFLPGMFAALFAGAQLMLALRDLEEQQQQPSASDGGAAGAAWQPVPTASKQ